MLRSLAQAHDSTHDTLFKSFAFSALIDLVCQVCRSCVGVCVRDSPLILFLLKKLVVVVVVVTHFFNLKLFTRGALARATHAHAYVYVYVYVGRGRVNRLCQTAKMCHKPMKTKELA